MKGFRILFLIPLGIVLTASPTRSQIAQATDKDISWMGPPISLDGTHKLEPPSHPLRGYLSGLPFCGEKAVFTNGASLTVTGSTGKIVLFLRGSKNPWGQTIRLKTTARFLSDEMRGTSLPTSAAISFDQPMDGRVRGRLVMATMDAREQITIHLSGEFEAEIDPAKDAEIKPFASVGKIATEASPYVLTSLNQVGVVGNQYGVLGQAGRTVKLPDRRSGDLYWIRFIKNNRYGLVMGGAKGVGVHLYTCDGQLLGTPGAPRRAILDPPPEGRFIYALVTGPNDTKYNLLVREAIDLTNLSFPPISLKKTYNIAIPDTAHKIGRDLIQGYSFKVPANHNLHVIQKRGPTGDRRPSISLLSPEGIIVDSGSSSGFKVGIKDAGLFLLLLRTPKPSRFSLYIDVLPIK